MSLPDFIGASAGTLAALGGLGFCGLAGGAGTLTALFGVLLAKADAQNELY
jgi:hypothetical protein